MEDVVARLEALEQRSAAMERQLHAWRRVAGACLSLVLLLLALGLVPLRPAGAAATLDQRVAALESKLYYVTRVGQAMYFTGVNVHLRNGANRTDAANGLGNLIVGYNELRPNNPDGSNPNVRTGSHNVIVGYQHNYGSFGGLVVGNKCQILAPYASVTGGLNNTARGLYAHVSGGRSNTASGEASCVSGGYVNIASAFVSSVSGGNNNKATGDAASVSGGGSNLASNRYASVTGGSDNAASGEAASVSGGGSNVASNRYASVTGGSNNTASGEAASVSGGTQSGAAGPRASVSGGWRNSADGDASAVSGGSSRSVGGADDWRAGGYFQDF
ncbi:MAG TPA: hypothetical protein VGX50_07185 [Longimicrobium sp.]|jgi:hypothetical protein|nr:hypothetical protein [Longimicrobium sp.]